MSLEIQLPSTSAASHHAPGALLGRLRGAVFLVSLPFGILNFALPIYGRALGARPVEIGLFFTAFSLVLVVLRPVVGAGIERFGRRPFLLAGLAAYALTMLTFALLQDITGILAARTLQGMASALLWLAVDSATADLAGSDRRGFEFGRVGQAANRAALLGAFAGMGILAFFGFSSGWKPLFLGYAVCALGAVGWVLHFLPETRPPVVSPAPSRVRWNRALAVLLSSALVTSFAWALVSPVLLIYLQDRLGVDGMELASAYIPAALVWAFIPAQLGRLADRTGRKPLMVLGCGAAALSSFLIPGLHGLTALALLWAFQALCFAAGDPAEQAMLADLAGENQRGPIYGLYATAGGLGAAFGPLAGGWLYQSTGPAWPFIANGVLLTICAVGMALLLPRK